MDELWICDVVYFMGYCVNLFLYVCVVEVFVLSSCYEGFGMVFGEVMVFGMLVFVVDCLIGLCDMFDDGCVGLFVLVGDVDVMLVVLECFVIDVDVCVVFVFCVVVWIVMFDVLVVNWCFVVFVVDLFVVVC